MNLRRLAPFAAAFLAGASRAYAAPKIDFNGSTAEPAAIVAFARQQPAAAVPAVKAAAPAPAPRGDWGWDKSKARRYAADLAPKAEQLYGKYREVSDTGNWLEKIQRRANLDALGELKNAALNLNAELQTRHPTRASTEDAFNRLQAAFEKLDSIFPGSHRFNRVDNEYYDLVRVYRQIERLYR